MPNIPARCDSCRVLFIGYQYGFGGPYRPKCPKCNSTEHVKRTTYAKRLALEETGYTKIIGLSR